MPENEVKQPADAVPVERQVRPLPGWRTWGDNGSRCAHCCNGDRCDDPTHYDRTSKRGCPHCLSTGYALWTEAGRAEKAEHDERWANYRSSRAA